MAKTLRVHYNGPPDTWNWEFHKAVGEHPRKGATYDVPVALARRLARSNDGFELVKEPESEQEAPAAPPPPKSNQQAPPGAKGGEAS